MFWLFAHSNYYRIKLLNQFYGHIKVSIYIYAILKYVFRKTSTINTASIKLLALILSPIVFGIIWLLKITKTFVSIWIACTDPDYVSMLGGTETIFIAQETKQSRAIITTLFLLDNQTYDLSGDAFYEFCAENITSIFQKSKFLKLQCCVRYKLGYFYFKKQRLPINEFLKPLDCKHFDGNMNQVANNEKMAEKMTLTMEQLRVYISEVSNLEMPRNGDCLWEARIGKQKLEGTNLYPMILRFNHIFGDAITFFNMFTVDFQTNHKANSMQEMPSEVRSLDASYIHNPFVTMIGMADPPDSNVLCHTSGDKHIVWLTESTPRILNTIKEIKQKQKHATVVDVMLTCFMESLVTHFTKLNISLPQSVYTVLPMMPNGISTAYGRVTNYAMSNKISLAILRLPLQLRAKDKQHSLLKRLELIKHEYNVFKNISLDYWFNRWQGTVILNLLPWHIQEWFIRKYGTSLMVSNIPGCESLEFFGRFKVKEFVFIDPNTSISGVSLMITSYEKRLNFAYTIDKSVIPNVEDVKKISTDFMDNLQKLNELTT